MTSTIAAYSMLSIYLNYPTCKTTCFSLLNDIAFSRIDPDDMNDYHVNDTYNFGNMLNFALSFTLRDLEKTKNELRFS